MKSSALLFILSGVVLNAVAQLLLKAGTNRLGVVSLDLQTAWSTFIAVASQWPIMAGLVCYGISLVVWIMGLSRVDVTIAYPMLSIGYVINAVGAWWLLGETLSPQRLTAVAIILLGVVLLYRS
jgi:multidrug transporter EmrE-like cation transporter